MKRTTSRTVRSIFIVALTLGSVAAVHAQQVTVEGRVVDTRTDQPIAGAAVTVEGSTARATTGANGEFTVAVPGSGATLIVNRPGYSIGRVTLRGQTEVVVRLSTTVVELDEVVVVGYGTQRKSDVTGSVATVTAAQLADKAVTTVEQALQGRVPGVTITTQGGGAEPRNNFQIRGRNSIKASDEPLIVVDGIPYNGTISEINQNDVASINVLKDASAAAIYGARGSNGVVLITTKKGSGGPRISYEGYTGVQDYTNLPEVMGGAEFAQFKCDRLGAQGRCASVLTGSELANLEAGRFTDWLGLAVRTGQQQQHNLSFSGGGGGTRYYVSGSLLDVQGVARNDAFQRLGVRVNLDQELKSWFRIGTNTQLSQVDRGGLPANFEDAFFMNPLTRAYEDNGSLTVTPWPEDIFWNNPLQGHVVVDDDVSRRVFASNYLEVDAPFLTGLSYRLNGGLDFAQRDGGRYYGRNTLTGMQARGQATTEHTARFDWTVENLLTFRRDFGDHGINFTGLFSLQDYSLDTERLRSEGFPNDVLTYRQANVGALLVPGYTVVDSRLISQMARLNYDYAERYLLTVTARRDGYSGFGENNKYGVFPSVALGWNVSNEPFWGSSPRLNSLKLRASYGQNGNQAISPYQTLARLEDLSYVSPDNRTEPGFFPQTLGNPNLRWETSTSLNLGADFGLFEDRVTGTLDLYRSTTTDLLLDRLVSPVHGIRRIAENIGEVENRGIELQLSTINLETPAFSWSTDFNIAANRNEIVDLYGNGEDDVLNRWFIGRPISVYYEYDFGGIFQNPQEIAGSAQPTAKPGDVRVVDLNGDGRITPEDRTFLGTLEPSYTAGLTNTLRYRQLTLSAFLNTVQGVSRPNPLRNTNLVHNEVRRNTIRATYWTPENPINDYPRNHLDANVFGVDFFEDASFIRLKDVTLSYDVPSGFRHRFGLQGLRLYLNGRNLWTHTDWTGMDPELGLGESPGTGNTRQRDIPLERVLVGGINVQF